MISVSRTKSYYSFCKDFPDDTTAPPPPTGKHGDYTLTTGGEVLGEHPTPKFLCLLSSFHPESDNLCNYAFFPTVYCLYTVFSKPWDTASKFMKSAKKAHKEKKITNHLIKGCN